MAAQGWGGVREARPGCPSCDADAAAHAATDLVVRHDLVSGVHNHAGLARAVKHRLIASLVLLQQGGK